MSVLSFYFEAHQPRRLKKSPVPSDPFDDVLNREVLEKVSKKCYLPANAMFSRLIEENENFKICLSVTGTLLEQAVMFNAKLVDSFANLGRLARETGRVEFLNETYYHSLTGLFKDGNKEEFKAQIKKHREMMEKYIGVTPKSFRNTELLYNNSIATIAAELGYKSILCEKRDDMIAGHSPNAVFADSLDAIKVIPRNYDLSDELAFRFTHRHFTADSFADWVARIDGEVAMIGMDYEAIGEHQWEDTGIFKFWEHLPKALAERPNIVMKNPTEIAHTLKEAPRVSVDDLATSSWADEGRNTNPWLGNRAQQSLFHKYQDLETKIKLKGDEHLLDTWRHLGTSDNFYYMCTTRHGADGGVHEYFSHFHDVTESIVAYTTALVQLSTRRAHKTRSKPGKFAARRYRRPRILLVTPEITELASGFGNLSNVVSAKGGGLADISSALIDEMMKMGLDVHVAIPKYERQIREYSQISQRELDRLASIFQGPKRIHLVQDSSFSHIRDVYEKHGANDALARAVAFQEKVINTVLSEAMPAHGKMLVHCNDWMTGLIPAAAKDRGFKTMFTIHNIYSEKKTLRELETEGIDVSRFYSELYLEQHPDSVPNPWETIGVDFLLSGIKASDFVNTVSPTFLTEIVNGYFPDIISWQAREEFKAKYYAGAASGILNAPKANVHPAIGKGLELNYDETNFVEGKKVNKVAFQERTGLNVDENAPLMFWPSRLFSQKGPELLAAIAQPLVDFYRDQHLQIAVVANGDFGWERIYGQIACTSEGRIAYTNFDAGLSELGKAAADFILMPSLYEPCGLPQMEGMRYGTLPIVRATGGLKDTVQHLNIEADTGNGFVFNDYVSDAFWWACSEAMVFWSKPEKRRHRILRRVMREGFDNFNLEKTTLEYVRVYEKLLGEKLV
ncbi:MAG: glycogen/starch synthase [Deltaproteobacteria bacterium]|nr:glycogen/starch synthase [Deltaproteobacteria bacterium]MBN2670523.1 glycogen/starch synthase [Deltaproteobacteria bacterium]